MPLASDPEYRPLAPVYIDGLGEEGIKDGERYVRPYVGNLLVCYSIEDPREIIPGPCSDSFCFAFMLVPKGIVVHGSVCSH